MVLEDGTTLPADLVVYATGYGSMNGWAADLISADVADKVGKVWALGSDTTKDPGPWEGEQRNMWKPTQQQALWFHGSTLPDLRLAVATYGTLNEAKDNAILIPTWFAGTHQTWELVYIGSGRALDPDRWFIMVVNQIGNGLSTSPHTAGGGVAMSRFPHVTIGDDVRAQEQLLRQVFGIDRLALVVGGSMGAQQTSACSASSGPTSTSWTRTSASCCPPLCEERQDSRVTRTSTDIDDVLPPEKMPLSGDTSE